MMASRNAELYGRYLEAHIYGAGDCGDVTRLLSPVVNGDNSGYGFEICANEAKAAVALGQRDGKLGSEVLSMERLIAAVDGMVGLDSTATGDLSAGKVVLKNLAEAGKASSMPVDAGTGSATWDRTAQDELIAVLNASIAKFDAVLQGDTVSSTVGIVDDALGKLLNDLGQVIKTELRAALVRRVVELHAATAPSPKAAQPNAADLADMKAATQGLGVVTENVVRLLYPWVVGSYNTGDDTTVLNQAIKALHTARDRGEITGRQTILVSVSKDDPWPTDAPPRPATDGNKATAFSVAELSTREPANGDMWVARLGGQPITLLFFDPTCGREGAWRTGHGDQDHVTRKSLLDLYVRHMSVQPCPEHTYAMAHWAAVRQLVAKPDVVADIVARAIGPNAKMIEVKAAVAALALAEKSAASAK